MSRWGLLLLPVTSAAAPLAGVLTAPLLSHALGVSGRGQAAASLAAYALISNTATIGLPEAIIFFVARRTGRVRRMMLQAVTLTTPIVLLGILATWVFADDLAASDRDLAVLIVLAAWAALPATYLGLLRAVAYGSQRWELVSVEQAISAAGRVVVLLVLFLSGLLTVPAAVIVSVTIPLVATLAYLPLIRPRAAERVVEIVPLSRLLEYGVRVWGGSIALIVYGRLGQLALTPLAGAHQLGLYVVAVTIADAPLIVVAALKEAVFGIASRESDPDWLARASRILGSAVLAIALVGSATVSFWIGPLFGAGFRGAVLTTVLLLLAAAIGTPGVVATAGLGAWNRPGARSLITAGTLTVYAVAFFVTVPELGATGAAAAGVLSSIFSTVASCRLAGRVLGVRTFAFFVPHRNDVAVMTTALSIIGRRIWSRGATSHSQEDAR